MIWSLIDDSNARFNLWRNITGGYNETFRKGVNPNVCRKKSILELELEHQKRRRNRWLISRRVGT